MKNRSIKDIVGENHVFASVLHYFGISFYDYSDKTLEQVCEERQLDVNTLISKLERIEGDKKDEDIEVFPVDLIIEYLVYKHHYFVKKRLPYISSIINGLGKRGNQVHDSLIDDLKESWPLFVEDFIKHLYEEEDTLFSYINKLQKALKNSNFTHDLSELLDSYNVQKFALEHEQHSNEMDGFRELTKDYFYSEDMGIHLKVIMQELKSFDEELHMHASIEDKVLFPKALNLENSIRMIMMEKISYN